MVTVQSDVCFRVSILPRLGYLISEVVTGREGTMRFQDVNIQKVLSIFIFKKANHAIKSTHIHKTHCHTP